MTSSWPRLTASEWIDTRHTLHLWTQMVGKSVANFYTATIEALDQLGVRVDLFARPVEIPTAIAFAKDIEHHSYDADAVHGESQLPYVTARTSDGLGLDAALLAFLQSTYDAAAVQAGWDRAALEAGLSP